MIKLTQTFCHTLSITRLTHYICDVMKSIIIYSILFLSMVNYAFGQDWHSVQHASTNVVVEFPKVPKLAEEKLYTKNGITKKTVYSTNFNNIEMVYHIEKLVNNEKKTIKSTVDRLIENTVVVLKGTTPKVIKKKDKGITYNYIETPLISGELVRSVVFVYNNYAYQLYTKGIITDVFNADGHRFLNSWNLENSATEQTKEKKKSKTAKIVEEFETEDSLIVWESYQLSEQLEVQLPGVPFKQTTVVEGGAINSVIESYAYNAPKANLNFVITIQPYSNEQGQLTNASIYSYYLERIKKKKQFKLVKEEAVERPHEGIEYVFSKGIQFYRLKLIRVNNVMYQFLIKGKRKSIYNEESAQFFNHINIIN